MKTSMTTDRGKGGTRRRFLGQGAALVGGVLAGAEASAAEIQGAATGESNLPPNLPAWTKAPGADLGSQLYGMPSKFESGVVKNVPKGLKQYKAGSVRSPLQDLDGIITPNGLFYERVHGGIPDIDPAEHRLLIHGLVDNPLILTVDEVRRFPSESRIHFIECAGNPSFEAMKGKTASDLFGLTSCAEWTGVRLKTILEEAGLKPEARWIVAEGADSAALVRSVPIEKCLDDALIVYSQNGERLRPQQGYPLRLLLPGFVGNMNIKWLRRLHVTAEATYARDETSRYTDLMPDGTAWKFPFFMDAKSIITRPSGTQHIAKGFNEITGIAWSGHGRITGVEISVDDGKSWAPANLQTPVLTRAFTRFRFPWHWDGTPTVIQSRATDETGYVQPSFKELTDARGFKALYHNNSIVPWRIAANGEVSNGFVKA